MKKSNYFKLICLGLCLGVLCQLSWSQTLSRSVIGATGSINPELTYTVGQSITKTATSSVMILSQGFQQPDKLIGTFISDLGEEASFNLYPNPTQDRLTLEFDSQKPFWMDISIIDMRGRRIGDKRKVMTSNASSIDLDVSNLATGSYSIILQSGKKIKTLRFQKID